MLFDWPWSKFKSVKCPDGSIQHVYRDLNDVFPLVFRDAKRESTAAIKALESVNIDLGQATATQLRGLAIAINERNSSLQSHLRAAYALYIAAPCKKLDDLSKAIHDLREEEAKLLAAKYAVDQIVSIISAGGLSKDIISQMVAEKVADAIITLRSHAHSQQLAAAVADAQGQITEWSAQ
jgi:hypothetical protein